ncbi:lysyl-tRNA synthetase, class 2 [Desulfuromusa kysingii]|uniref:Lysyl-tRNA synthetase, class 2 n=1 Tax=Desulfuromusa kysingii TaxID=37625 RepID=A0A1H3WWJ5_9BACT|nr:EF-P lysine aminoacylase EpmA [Desulfuromusa kysingii]SDZ91525.1 lysyl-tRNA synthetase, class 2 [Desulfuromusa kysingii]
MMIEPNWQIARKRHTLENRARIIQQIRAFFIRHDFLEVETPHRIPANAPELNIDAVPAADWFLQTSPELCMKRLLAAGFERLFQICHCWRAGERSNTHLPEYSMLEWYRSHCDYRQLMADCEALLTELKPDHRIFRQGQTIDLTPPWPRLTVADAFLQFSSMPLATALATDEFDSVMAFEIEPNLPKDRPLFLFEYPVEHASLARKKISSPAVAERFELYIGGLELANAFSELTDPVEQQQRFTMEEMQRRKLGKTPYPTPEPFIKELATLPPSAGIALGIDRLIMLLCDKNNIDDVVSFSPEQL